MGLFQSEFQGLDSDTKKRLHDELWEIFSSRVRELEKNGASKGETEGQALRDTKKTFISRHPEMARANWGIRVVGP